MFTLKGRQLKALSKFTREDRIEFSSIILEGNSIYATDSYKMVRIKTNVDFGDIKYFPLEVFDIIRAVDEIKFDQHDINIYRKKELYTTFDYTCFSEDCTEEKNIVHALENILDSCTETEENEKIEHNHLIGIDNLIETCELFKKFDNRKMEQPKLTSQGFLFNLVQQDITIDVLVSGIINTEE